MKGSNSLEKNNLNSNDLKNSNQFETQNELGFIRNQDGTAIKGKLGEQLSEVCKNWHNATDGNEITTNTLEGRSF